MVKSTGGQGRPSNLGIQTAIPSKGFEMCNKSQCSIVDSMQYVLALRRCMHVYDIAVVQHRHKSPFGLEGIARLLSKIKTQFQLQFFH